jgi:hypothetical protein
MGGKHISRFCSSGEIDRGEGGETNSVSAYADADKKQPGLPNRRAAISSESLERIRYDERTGQDGDQQPLKCLPKSREKRGGFEGEGSEANGCDGRAPNFYLEVLPCANRSVLQDTTRRGGGTHDPKSNNNEQLTNVCFHACVCVYKYVYVYT